MTLVSFRTRTKSFYFGRFLVVVLFSLLFGVNLLEAETSSELAQWRAKRLQRLTAPDGWLTLIGLHWLKPGMQGVGADQGNAIVLAKGPPLLGEVIWEEATGQVTFRAEPGIEVRVDGNLIAAPVVLSNDEEKPTRIQVGTLTLQVISRGDRKALRVKDNDASTRTHFHGLEYFPENPFWKIEAQWLPFSPPPTIKVQNIVGTVSTESVPGKAIFERDGKTYELWPIQETGDETLFFIFSDQTSGKETYGAARFLFTDPPKDGKLLLDFNRAINPPCAFTPFATCPLPPSQNRLTLRVAAGEKLPPDSHP